MSLNESPVNIESILSNLYEYYLMRKEAIKPNSNIQLKLNIDNELNDLYIQIDEFRLKQIITNLLDNALKFTNEGTIEFGCTISKESRLLFTVSDTGIGIRPDKQEIVFDRFRQVDDLPETRQFGGTGLGLSIAKGLVNLMGGEIWMESKEGIGTKFFFSIPYNLVKLANEEQFREENSNDPNWKGKTILIVEDDKSNAELLNAMLSNSHAKLINANNGRTAITEFKENPNIDLVLLDIRLPDEHGLNLVPIMKGLQPQIPIIAQTAFASNDDNRKCLDAGCDGYISKPINYDELIHLLSKLIS